MSVLSIGRGIPLALSIAALSVSFNWKFSEWIAGVGPQDSGNRLHHIPGPNRRDAELKRHGYLLGLGAIGLISAGVSPSAMQLVKLGVNTLRTPRTMALAGMAWGGALTIGSAIVAEWDHYSDGWKVTVTGGSLAALLAAAALL